MNQLARYIIALAVVTFICFLAWYFSNILTYILIAAILSILGKPIVHFLDSLHFKRWKIPHSICAFIALMALGGLFAALFSFILPFFSQLIRQIATIDMEQIAANLAAPLHKINQFLHQYVPGIEDDLTVQTLFSQYISTLINDFSFTQYIGSLANILIKLGIALFTICFVTFFFLNEKDMFNNIVLSLFPEKYEAHASRAMQSTHLLLTRYFIGIFIEIFAITTLNTIGLTLICGFDFKLAIILAFLQGVLNVIPYIGPFVGGSIGVIFGILTYYQPAADVSLLLFILPIALVYIVTNTIDVYVFQPYIYSNSVKAHPLEIFLVILIAGSIGGVVGMLVAIPAYTVIRVFAREFFYNFKVVRRLTQKMNSP